MLPSKEAAKAAFNHSKSLQQVHVTSDGETFVLLTDANLHANDNKLDDKAVITYNRADLVEEIPTPINYSTLALADVVAIIDASTEIGHIKSISDGDPRPGVTTAAIDRINELEALNDTK